jgi:hypothetical protein
MDVTVHITGFTRINGVLHVRFDLWVEGTDIEQSSTIPHDFGASVAQKTTNVKNAVRAHLTAIGLTVPVNARIDVAGSFG